MHPFHTDPTSSSRGFAAASSLCVVVLMLCRGRHHGSKSSVASGLCCWSLLTVFQVFAVVRLCSDPCGVGSISCWSRELKSLRAMIDFGKMMKRNQTPLLWHLTDSATGATLLNVHFWCFLGSTFQTVSQDEQGRVAP